jgi:hypothetical protein
MSKSFSASQLHSLPAFWPPSLQAGLSVFVISRVFGLALPVVRKILVAGAIPDKVDFTLENR